MPLILDFLDLPAFEPILRQLVEKALHTGEKALENKGHTMPDIKKDRKLARFFIRECHKGYDFAQKQIVKEIIAHCKIKDALKKELKEHRKNNNRDAAKNNISKIEVLDNRILVMRRLIDTIAMTLIQHRTWIANRFILHEYIKDIDIGTLVPNAREASLNNSQDRLAFSLVTDLTTFIDVGDLLKIDFNINGREKWELIELKQGNINKILQGIIKEEGRDIPKEKIDEIEKNISKSAPAQLSRMVRQLDRLEKVDKVKYQNEVTDISMGVTVKLNEDEVPVDCYDDAIRNAIKEAHKNGISISRVDGCLYVVATRASIGAAVHALYHVKNPQIECAFKLGDDSLKQHELNEINNIQHVTDLISPGLKARTGTPIFLYPFEQESIFDLIFGRTFILLHLSIEGLSNLCKEMGCTLILESRKQSDAAVKEFSRYHVPMIGHRTLKLICPSGQEIHIMSGFFRRIIADFQRPRKVVELFCENIN